LTFLMLIGVVSGCFNRQPSQEDLSERREKLRDEVEGQLRRELAANTSASPTAPGLERGAFVSADPVSFERAASVCTRDLRPAIAYRMKLDAGGRPVEVDIIQGSGSQRCDEALTKALMESKWRSCKTQGRGVACQVESSLALPPLHHRTAE